MIKHISYKFIKIPGKDYSFQATPVTQKQWTKIMGENPSHFKMTGAKANYNHPVESISWNDCQEFIKKLNEKSKKWIYRLPTEAEWEHACRAGTTTEYFWGDDESKADEYAWHYGNSSDQTQPVGLKKPNAWGLYDMSGNVWEWCEDLAHCSFRDLRGGSWDDGPQDLRSAGRGNGIPGTRGSNYGFRLTRSLKTDKTKIKLTQGYEALIDESDYETLSKMKWHYKQGYAFSDNTSMQRILLSPPKEMQVDHINGNRLDNRRSNLRICTGQQNQFNQKPQKKGSSKYKGVHWNTQKKRWRAQIMLHKKRCFIGLFKDEKEAAKAYDERAKELFGEYAYLNFPCDSYPLSLDLSEVEEAVAKLQQAIQKLKETR